MYYEIEYKQKNSGRRFHYIEAKSVTEAEEKVMEQKSHVEHIIHINETTKEIYDSIYSENKNPLMIYSVPLDILPFEFEEKEKRKEQDIKNDREGHITIVATGFQKEE